MRNKLAEQYKDTYNSWRAMRERCNNPKHKNYSDYGGRGITCDPRWSSFLNFLEDMGERPEKHSLDRVDNNGNYTLDNCRWATQRQQVRNARSNIRLEDGRLLCELAEEAGLPYWPVYMRYRRKSTQLFAPMRVPKGRKIDE